MGHGFRFSLDERYILDKSQMACESEEPYPQCWKIWDCNYPKRFFCLLWDIFNIDRDYCDSEMRKQKKLDDFQIFGVAAVGRKAVEQNLGIMNRSEEVKVAISGPLLQVNILDYLGEKTKQEKKDQKKLNKLKGVNAKSKKGFKNPKSMRYRR